MASDKITQTTDATFDADVLQSPLPVLVDFWAVWCGPCKAISPILEQLAVSHDGRLKIAKVDVDNNPGIAMKYSVRSLPTLLVFKNGAVVKQHVGAAPRAQIEKLLSDVI